MQQQEIAASLRRDKYRNNVADAFHSPFTFLFDNSPPLFNYGLFRKRLTFIRQHGEPSENFDVQVDE